MHHLLNIYKALADQNRLKLIDLLITHDLCVGALANRLGLSKPAVSQHLQILRKAGLVKGEKRGYFTHYSIERSTLHRIAEEIRETADLPIVLQGACQKAVYDSTPNKDERRDIDMCRDCCQKPENLEDTPKHCSPEQIKKCHGDTEEHPCIEGEKPDDDHR